MVSLRTLTQHCGDTAHGSFPAAFYFYTSWAPPKPDEGTKPGRLPTATKPYTTSPKTNPKKIRKKTAKDAAAVTQASISSVYFERLLPYTRTRIVALELAALACHWRALWQVGLCLCVHYYFFFLIVFSIFGVCWCDDDGRRVRYLRSKAVLIGAAPFPRFIYSGTWSVLRRRGPEWTNSGPGPRTAMAPFLGGRSSGGRHPRAAAAFPRTPRDTEHLRVWGLIGLKGLIGLIGLVRTAAPDGLGRWRNERVQIMHIFADYVRWGNFYVLEKFCW